MNTSRNRIRSWLVALGIAVGLALGSAREARAQVYLGPQVNLATDTDLGVGGRLLANIEDANLEFASSFDVFFPEGPADYWELNGNLFYHFHLPENPSVLPYLGGGLNVATFSNGDSNTETGLNLGGGARFPLENVSPYVEGRAVVGGVEQFVFTFGILLGHAHGQ